MSGGFTERVSKTGFDTDADRIRQARATLEANTVVVNLVLAALGTIAKANPGAGLTINSAGELIQHLQATDTNRVRRWIRQRPTKIKEKKMSEEAKLELGKKPEQCICESIKRWQM